VFIFLFKYLTTAVRANKIIIIINQWENHARAAAPWLMAISGCLISLPCVCTYALRLFINILNTRPRLPNAIYPVAGYFRRPDNNQNVRLRGIFTLVLLLHRHMFIRSLDTGARFTTEEIHHYKHITISVAWKSLEYIIVYINDPKINNHQIFLTSRDMIIITVW